MKKIIVLLLLMCTHTSFLQALIGKCIVQGPETPSSYNYEKWHFVECYHDCDDTLHYCVECGHHHAPKEKQIVVTSSSHNTSNTHLNAPPTLQKSFAYIARRAKSNTQKTSY